MRKIFTSALFIFAFTSLLSFGATEGGEPPEGPPPAEGDGPGREKPDPAKFPEHKAHVLKMLDERLKNLQAAKTCVTNSKDHEAMKKCHDNAMKERHGFREERREFKEGKAEDRKEDRIQWKKKREEWKEKRGDAKKNKAPGDDSPPQPPTDANQ
jgi:hypothetical protein